MAKVVTYLEMNSAADLRPGEVVPDLLLRRVDGGLPHVCATNAQIGAPTGGGARPARTTSGRNCCGVIRCASTGSSPSGTRP
ncbi:hypothetical protein NKG94_12420 [Micromonospora sp. M12]